MIPYTKHRITPDDEAAVLAVLRSPYLTQGPKVEEFEAALAKKAGAKYCVCVSSGTAALYLTYGSFSQGGVFFVTSPITFVATANMATYFGQVAFVDVDPDTGNWSPRHSLLVETDQPTVLVPVTLGGIQVNWQIPPPNGNRIVVDATHSLGAAQIGQADAMCFSFHPAKLVAAGEGGAVVTNNENAVKAVRSMRDHGRDPDRACIAPGWNFRMSEIHAALGLSQLSRLEQNIARRQTIASFYDAAFQDHVATVDHGAGSARHLYQILVEQRDHVRTQLAGAGIGSQIHYHPVHLQPYYQRRGFKFGDYPGAESYAARTLSIPMYPTLTDAEVGQQHT